MPLQDYQILTKIGAGKFSTVYKVRRLSDGAVFALKKMQVREMNVRQKKNCLTQVRLLNSIKHPNIVTLVQSFYDQFIDCLCLILELADNGDLSYAIRNNIDNNTHFSQQQIWQFILQIARGLEFMHSNNLLHRDIKTNNVLLFKDGTLKISDFNVSKVSDGLNYTRTGTLCCASPQIWKGDAYNSKSDIWSFGCLLYELVCLKKPFQGSNMQEIFKKISKCQYTKIKENYSIQLKDLISFMIQINPGIRPSATTICKMCKHQRKQAPIRKQHQRISSFVLRNNLNLTESGILLEQESNSRQAVRPRVINDLCRLPKIIRLQPNKSVCSIRRKLSEIQSKKILQKTTFKQQNRQATPLPNNCEMIFKLLGPRMVSSHQTKKHLKVLKIKNKRQHTVKN